MTLFEPVNACPCLDLSMHDPGQGPNSHGKGTCCCPLQKMSVGGTIGGRRGGEARKQQMAEEHGGDVHAAYSEMGQTGAKKGEWRLGLAASMYHRQQCITTASISFQLPTDQ